MPVPARLCSSCSTPGPRKAEKRRSGKLADSLASLPGNARFFQIRTRAKPKFYNADFVKVDSPGKMIKMIWRCAWQEQHLELGSILRGKHNTPCTCMKTCTTSRSVFLAFHLSDSVAWSMCSSSSYRCTNN